MENFHGDAPSLHESHMIRVNKLEMLFLQTSLDSAKKASFIGVVYDLNSSWACDDTCTFWCNLFRREVFYDLTWPGE